jgi:acyl-[acyl-carrier-protein]-phospholipid O-acyltransferase / long-chain-fatty-acid--[acyl-carrier-protein] ligase
MSEPLPATRRLAPLFNPRSFTALAGALLRGRTATSQAATRPSFHKAFAATLLRLASPLDIRGRENFTGGCVVALNHTSLLDAALASAILPPPLVFVTFGQPGSEPARLLRRLFPIEEVRLENPLSLRRLIDAKRAGKTVVFLLPTGASANGASEAHGAAAYVAEKCGATILRMDIDGAEASMFALHRPRLTQLRWRPRHVARLHPPVRLEISMSASPRARRRDLGEALRRSMSDLAFESADLNRNLHEALAKAARRHGFARLALEDAAGGALSYRSLLTRTRALAGALRRHVPEGEAVGLIDDSGLGFLALSSAGCTPVMLDCRAGLSRVRAGLAAAGARRVVVSRAFVNGARLAPAILALEAEAQVFYLEDLQDDLARLDILRARLLCARPLARRCADDLAAILFTAGAEGPPKAVALSHKNILANAWQMAARLEMSREDLILSALPLQSGFGLVAGFVLPLLRGVPVRLDAERRAARRLARSQATILLATAAFLDRHGRTARVDDFRRLRYAVVAGEPAPSQTRALWREKFGVRLFEAYGATEATAALAMNTPTRYRVGSVGHFLPGVKTRLEPVAAGFRLFAQGSNIMLGYLDPEDPGALRASADRWLDLGDIVDVDSEGFVYVRGRAARFAGIASSVASLADVEALARDLWPRAFSVAAIEADTRKGERILLLTTEKTATRAKFVQFARAAGASELLIPFDIVVVEDLPRLGSGAPDYAGVTRLARDRARLAPMTPRAPNGLGRIDGGSMSGV